MRHGLPADFLCDSTNLNYYWHHPRPQSSRAFGRPKSWHIFSLLGTSSCQKAVSDQDMGLMLEYWEAVRACTMCRHLHFEVHSVLLLFSAFSPLFYLTLRLFCSIQYLSRLPYVIPTSQAHRDKHEYVADLILTFDSNIRACLDPRKPPVKSSV